MEPYYNIVDCFTSDSMPIGFGFWLKTANMPRQSRAGHAGQADTVSLWWVVTAGSGTSEWAKTNIYLYI